MTHILTSYHKGMALPTKPFGVPYAYAVIFENGTQCILADTVDEIMNAWSTDFSSQSLTEQRRILFSLARSVVSQIQATILESIQEQTIASMSPEERDALVWDYQGVFPLSMWSQDFPLVIVDSEGSKDLLGMSVKRFYAGDTETFIKSLHDFGIIEIGVGDFSYRGSPLMLN